MKLICVCTVATLATACVITLLAAPYAQTQTYKEKVLHSFGKGNDGDIPEGGVIRDAAGNLYGTTDEGGPGYGTVFKLNKAGKETMLYRFEGGCCAFPHAGVIRDAAGNLYGTTATSGPYNGGEVFKLSKTGVETVLHIFGKENDGRVPLAGVIRDAQGNLYGTTRYFGNGSDNGTVFKLSKTGKETVLYLFTGGTDGAQPEAGVIRDTQGNLYGTTAAGGNLTCGGGYGCGVVFGIDTSGKETVLYTFIGGADGATPMAGVIQDAQGNLYGTTTEGGAYGWGTVFKLSKTGAETVLYTFSDGADGGDPVGGVIQDTQGNLYGTTYSGGTGTCEYGCGVVFKLDTAGKETVLYSFTGGTDGANPDAGVIQDANGNLFGTTYAGGAYDGQGTVFELTP